MLKNLKKLWMICEISSDDYMNVVIGIPVYNEERNIGNLLDDIMSQKLKHHILEKVLIISDDSTDKTDEIVSSFMSTYNNISLIRREQRTGKGSALNMMFGIIQSDILILLDADIRLDVDALNSLEKFFNEEDVGLIVGNPIPYPPKNLLNIAEHASFFSWVLVDKIKNISVPNLYHAHGRILILTKQLYKNISDIISLGDDQSIYLSCINNGLRVKYAQDTKVFYNLPKTSKDYLRQSERFSLAIKEKERKFGKLFMKKNMANLNNPLIFFHLFLRYPYKGLCWITLYTIGKLSVIVKEQKVSPIWEISKTTK